MHSRRVHLIGSFFAQSLESLRDYLVDLLLISPSDPCDLDDLDMLANQAIDNPVFLPGNVDLINSCQVDAIFDGLVKSRLTGENRCPVFS